MRRTFVRRRRVDYADGTHLRNERMSLTVDEIRDWPSLAALRPAWDELLGETPGATHFLSYDWLETYWHHFSTGRQLRVLVTRRGDQVAGIVPLVLVRERSSLGTTRRLTYPLDYWGSFYGPIGPQPAETLRAALGHLRRRDCDWDLLDLRHVLPDELDPADTAREMTDAYFTPHATQTDVTSLIDLPGSVADYLASRTPKFRNNLRRWQRRLHEQGAIRYVRYRPAGERHGESDPRWDLYDACEEVARKSWQGSSTTGTTITHDTVRPYLREAHAAACRAGAADLSLLYLDDHPIAFFYGYACHGTLYGLRIGYDRQASRNGAGNFLYLKVIEGSIARGDRTFDLGPGSLDVKRLLVSRQVPIHRLTYANPFTLRGLLWRAKRFCRGEQSAAPTSDIASNPDASSEPFQEQA